MRWDLPAPFSPRRAWTSPARRSKSTPSLATMRPKRFVMARSSSAASMGGRVWSPVLRPAADRVRRRDRSVEDLLLDLLDLVRVLRTVRAYLADPAAGRRQARDHVAAALVRVVLHGLDRVEDGDVDLLQRARD